MITDIKDMTSFRWATVTNLDPVMIQLDGDSAPLAMYPDSLVDPRSLHFGSRVRVEMSQRKAIIHGSANDGNDSMEAHAAIPYDTSILWWYHDNHATTVTDPYAPLIAHRTRLGLVMLEGLMTSRVALPAGTLLFTLDVPFRPLTRKRFVLSDAGVGAWGITIEFDGRVILNTAMPAGVLISFSGVVYNNDINLPRRLLVPLAGWRAAVGENPPAVAVDSLGRIFYEGVFESSGGVPSVYMTTLNPNEYNTQRGQLLVVNEFGSGTGANQMARIDATAAPLATSAARMSAGIPTVSATTKRCIDSINFNDTTNNNWTPLPFTSGSNYGSGWQEGGEWKAPDGAAHLRGLISVAAPTQNISQLMGSLMPRYRQLFISENADKVGRFDIAGLNAMLTNPTGIAGFYNLNHVTYWPAAIQVR